MTNLALDLVIGLSIFILILFIIKVTQYVLEYFYPTEYVIIQNSDGTISKVPAPPSTPPPSTGEDDTVVPSSSNLLDETNRCDPGFTKQGNLCIKKCYEHPSLADLYKRPDLRPNNAISQFGLDGRWENINSAQDYCYMCPPGYTIGSYNEVDKKMACVSKCPDNMADNPLAETCYLGYPTCSPMDSEEECAMRECPEGFTKKTNEVGQVICVKDNMECPAGMTNNPKYLGCWKQKIDATISTVEDMYILGSSDMGDSFL